MVSAAETQDDAQFEKMASDHKLLTNKRKSECLMTIWLAATYTGFALLTISNTWIIIRVAQNIRFEQSDSNLKMMIIDAFDSIHQVVFAVFFTIIFFFALARIELLIDVLPDIDKNRDAFLMHKIVWGAIAVNMIVHCIIAITALILNSNLTPNQ